MRVAVTGGTGFVGPAIVEELLAAGHEVTVLEHRTPVPLPEHPRLRRAKGDVTDRASLDRAFAGAQAVVHLVAMLHETPEKGITFEKVHVEGTRNAVNAAMGVGVSKFVLMSANGVGDPTMPRTEYFRTKEAMEDLVKSGPFEWTIFRPSYIAGARDPDARSGSLGFDEQFAEIVDKFPVLPSLDGGRFQIQPIARRNVAQAFARALERDAARGQIYHLAGPERMTWDDYLRRLARVRGKKRALAFVPRWAVLFAARRTPWAFPTRVDEAQLRMVMAGSIADPRPAVHDLDLQLIPWEQAVAPLAAR